MIPTDPSNCRLQGFGPACGPPFTTWRGVFLPPLDSDGRRSPSGSATRGDEQSPDLREPENRLAVMGLPDEPALTGALGPAKETTAGAGPLPPQGAGAIPLPLPAEPSSTTWGTLLCLVGQPGQLRRPVIPALSKGALANNPRREAPCGNIDGLRALTAGKHPLRGLLPGALGSQPPNRPVCRPRDCWVPPLPHDVPNPEKMFTNATPLVGNGPERPLRAPPTTTMRRDCHHTMRPGTPMACLSCVSRSECATQVRTIQETLNASA